MKMKGRLLSLLLALCMLMTLLPMNVLAAETEINNEDTDFVDVDAPPPDENDGTAETDETAETAHSDSGETPEDADARTEETDGQDADENNAGETVSSQKAGEVEEWIYVPESHPIMTLAESEASASDIVQVHVSATAKDTGEKVDVKGAVVNLYVGTEWKASAYTDDEGNAKVSLAGLTLTQRKNATISASKTVSQGKAINGNARDTLFSNFPKDGSGNYYRYTLELHSETVDDNGNWLGKNIPVSYETNKVDMVFAIDATGSMSGNINNVKDNIAHFSENLVASGLDIRFGIIEFQDITHDGDASTIVYKAADGSHWMTNIDDVIATLAQINAKDGGDGPETPIDALGYAAQHMKWRSDAYRFAFVLTDADYKNDNNYGYEDLAGITKALSNLDVVTSVITYDGYKDLYQGLVGGTGGIFADIYSTSFDQEMLSLSNSIVESVTKDVELELSEPRMLVNMSVCYFANDLISQSTLYRNGVKRMLNEYANRLAETTDGHVLLDKVILFSTSNRLDFYNTTKPASMADIRIETKEKDDGDWWFNVKVHSNAHVTGFYWDDIFTVDDRLLEYFEHLKDKEADNIWGRNTFYRIQMSGTEGANWNNSMLTAPKAYSTTVAHETGHYLFGFFDEYLNADGKRFLTDASGHRLNGVPDNFGLMDNQHEDIEMSKDNIDYNYIGNFASANVNLHTYQSSRRRMSTESWLATILTTGGNDTLIESGPYVAAYTKAKKDRTATYSYAALDDSDFRPLSSGSGGGGSWRVAAAEETTKPLSKDVSWSISDANTVAFTFKPVGDSSYSVDICKAGGEEFSPVTLNDSGDGKKTAGLGVAANERAEVRVTAGDKYNTYFIDRSGTISQGEVYLYSSADNGTIAYVEASTADSYTFVADKTEYSGNGDYIPLSQATYITSGSHAFSGEIYAVAAYLAEIDYTTLQWFKSVDNGATWTAVTIKNADYSEEENMNIGVRADLNGEGLYVLMAKRASANAEQVTIESVEPQTNRDATVTIHLTDPNSKSRSDSKSKFYNVYYSESNFTNKDDDGVLVTSFYADSTDLTLDVDKRDSTIYVGVEVVLENGSRSPLTRTSIATKAADSDDDGIPDWYCDQHLLWDKGDTSKPVAKRDPDGDGLTNLEEYQGESDPMDPDDPVHTSSVAVSSVSITPATLQITAGGTGSLTANVLPENATNKAVTWSSSNESIVTVSSSGTGSTCTITGVAVGTATITVTTSDGGYAASAEVTVNDSLGIAVTSVSITPAAIQVAVGGTGSLTANVLPENAANKAVTWRSSDESIVTVSSSGTGTTCTLTGVAVGTAAITVTTSDGSYTASAEVTVNDSSDIAVTSVSITPATIQVAVGGTGSLTANVLPENAANKAVTWRSSDESIVTVSSSGTGSTCTITGVAVGTATITVTTSDGSYAASAEVTVNDASDIAVTSVSITPATIQVAVGGTGSLTAIVSPSNAIDKSVTWFVDNESIVQITPDSKNSTCVVKGLAEGQATVTVKTADGSYTAASVISVSSSSTPTTPSNPSHGSNSSSGSSGGSSSPSIKPGNQPVTPITPTTNLNGGIAGFTDVSANAWYADSVKYVVERGLFGGVGDGNFAPDANMTRAMMWTVLARYMDVDTSSGSSWYEAARAWAIEKGISDGTLADGNVTREQFVTMLWRLSGEPTAPTSASFNDGGQISGYAKAAVDWAVAQGIVNGYNDGSFKPQGSATRAEVAKMLTVFCTNAEG